MRSWAPLKERGEEFSVIEGHEPRGNVSSMTGLGHPYDIYIYIYNYIKICIYIHVCVLIYIYIIYIYVFIMYVCLCAGV